MRLYISALILFAAINLPAQDDSVKLIVVQQTQPELLKAEVKPKVVTKKDKTIKKVHTKINSKSTNQHHKRQLLESKKDSTPIKKEIQKVVKKKK